VEVMAEWMRGSKGRKKWDMKREKLWPSRRRLWVFLLVTWSRGWLRRISCGLQGVAVEVRLTSRKN
jgi:hypothetical protein